MSVGNFPSKNEVDELVGAIAEDLFSSLERAVDFKTWLDAQLDADLQANQSYSAADISLLRSFLLDVVQLGRIFRGEEALAVAKDFRQFGKLIRGIGGI